MPGHGTEQLRIIVCGYIGLFPAAGAVWDYIQYPLGLKAMGHDVYYIEDTGNWPQYLPEDAKQDGSYNIEFLRRVMNDFGMQDRWAYLDPVSGEWAGMSENHVSQLRRDADLMISISCSAAVDESWLSIPVRAVIDSDPMFTQIQAMENTGFTRGSGSLREILGAYTHHFTFGERIGAADCRIPAAGFDWIPTRQPIVLDFWTPTETETRAPFTTVMNWSAGRPLVHDGEEWGQKDQQFEQLMVLPEHFPSTRFSIVVNAGPDFPRERLEASGWNILSPGEAVPDWQSYRDFIGHSAGEVSVAKHAYVKGRTGWFSCRTACYLAMGRPALVEDTGWSHVIPSGRGLLGFTDEREAVENMRELITDHRLHCGHARGIAVEFFDSGQVLGALLDQCGATT